jgi:hypothetical protein
MKHKNREEMVSRYIRIFQNNDFQFHTWKHSLFRRNITLTFIRDKVRPVRTEQTEGQRDTYGSSSFAGKHNFFFITKVEFACFLYVFFALWRSRVALVSLCCILKNKAIRVTEYPISVVLWNLLNTGRPPYPRVIRSKTYRGYAKLRIIPNVIYNVIFV